MQGEIKKKDEEEEQQEEKTTKAQGGTFCLESKIAYPRDAMDLA